MTLFLDCRLAPVGGELSTMVSINQGTSLDDYSGLAPGDLKSAIQGQNVLIGTHGFNVDRAAGIACLANWGGLLQLPDSSIFVGLLWPGDSVWAHGLDYPEEPKIANEAGALIAPFVDANFANAASVSFSSHSLGARVVLKTISQLSRPVRRVTIMAGAIDDNCLNTEFRDAVENIGTISALSSSMDEVLKMAFPIGNFVAGIIAEGHPWWRAALGHCGPAKPWAANFEAPFEIPNNWNYQHGDYLNIDSAPVQVPVLAIPEDVPAGCADPPAGGAQGWREAFSSAFASTRFR